MPSTKARRREGRQRRTTSSTSCSEDLIDARRRHPRPPRAALRRAPRGREGRRSARVGGARRYPSATTASRQPWWAERDRDRLHIVVCAEYDALPGVGHACGHNIIAAAAVGAGAALASVADDVGLTVTVLGTPAEEGGGGKILMLDQGAFEGAHAAMMVHPWPEDRLVTAVPGGRPHRGQLHRPERPRVRCTVQGDQRGRRSHDRTGSDRASPPAPDPGEPGSRDRHRRRGRSERRALTRTRVTS